jgi:hypothetical protein
MLDSKKSSFPCLAPMGSGTLYDVRPLQPILRDVVAAVLCEAHEEPETNCWDQRFSLRNSAVSATHNERYPRIGQRDCGDNTPSRDAGWWGIIHCEWTEAVANRSSPQLASVP